jgi:Mrp family chromosome partitioning ATPase
VRDLKAQSALLGHTQIIDASEDRQCRRAIGTVTCSTSTLSFVEEKRKVILPGTPGVGKTHLAIALGIAATNAGYRTLFTSAADLVASLRPPKQTAHTVPPTVPKGKASQAPSGGCAR